MATDREERAVEEMRSVEQAYRERRSEARALPVLAETASLADCLAYAALRNPGLEAAFYRWQAALMRVPQARSLPEPRLSYAYFIREVETRVGPQRHKLALAQAFPWFDVPERRGDAALAAAEAERRQYETARRKLFFEVQDAYLDCYYLGRAIALTRTNVELVTFLESVARTRYRTDAARHADVVKAQLELATLEDRLRSLSDRLQPARARLNAVLNRPADAPLPEVAAAPREMIALTEPELVERLRRHNPELGALAAVAEQEKQTAALAARRYYPDFNLGLELVETGSARTPGVHDSGKDPLIVMLSFSLPLWWNTYRAAEREAELRHLSALKRRADRENRLVAELKHALFAYRDAARRIELYENSLIPKATESLHVTQQAFAAGTSAFLDLIEAERTRLGFELERERALAEQPRRLAEIEMLVGEDLPRVPAGAQPDPEEPRP
ncbi:MAG: TolC family protein [Planctomycetes bacterium]|nr:TolC family protein [Planctomycetota bacterium]